MHLQIDSLRTFIALAEAKGFTRAGTQVGRSQSAVSMQIKRLEEEIGKTLFDRIGKSVKLTTDGSLLLGHALRIVKEHDDAVRALSAPDLKGFIRFGSPEHYTVGILPSLLAGFAASYPDVQVEMRCEDSDKIKAAVDAGELDIGICTQISEGGQVIAHDPLVWITPSDFVVQHHRPVCLAVFEEGCIFRAWALEALERANITFRIVYISRSVSGILDAVRAGLAIAPVVRTNVPDDINISGINQGLPVLPVPNIVLHKSKRLTSDIVECFGGHIVKAFGNLRADP